jgi:hypothetical protein
VKNLLPVGLGRTRRALHAGKCYQTGMITGITEGGKARV